MVQAGLSSGALRGGAATAMVIGVGFVAIVREERRLFVSLAVLDNCLINLTLARRLLAIKLGAGSSDNLLAEAGRMNAEVLNASEAGVVAVAALAAIVALGSGSTARSTVSRV